MREAAAAKVVEAARAAEMQAAWEGDRAEQLVRLVLCVRACVLSLPDICPLGLEPGARRWQGSGTTR